MPKPKIVVFSGPRSTIANSPTLVTGNKGRLPEEPQLPGRYDHLVAQYLAEPVQVRIKKFSAHPLEDDGKAVYHDDGKDYYEVELHPEDGPYLLPYVARRTDGSANGTPFEAEDLQNAGLNYGGRQSFYPDASRLFADLDRTIAGRNEQGEGSVLDRLADYEFVRALPPGGYSQQGETPGVDYFPYSPLAIGKRPRYKDLARATNAVSGAFARGDYAGGIWLEGSPTVEETIYWLSLMIDTNLPIAGCASQRPHGQLANDGDRNIVDAVEFILSGQGIGLGAVGMQDERIYAAREFKKADDRPGNYKATGGHGGILGTVGPPVTIWYRPTYNHTATSSVNLSSLPMHVEFLDSAGDSSLTSVPVKNPDGTLRSESIPRVHIVKYGAYSDGDDTDDPDQEVDIMARIHKGQEDQGSDNPLLPKLHGFVMEGTSPYAMGSTSQTKALHMAAFSGLPTVRVGRADPGGRVPSDWDDLTIAGSNLDTNKARLLLMAAMLKLGRLPKAQDPRNPSRDERAAVVGKIKEFQEIFETH